MAQHLQLWSLESASELDEVKDCPWNPGLLAAGAVLLAGEPQRPAVSLLSGASVPGAALIGSAGLIGPPLGANAVAKGMGQADWSGPGARAYQPTERVGRFAGERGHQC